MTNLTLDSYGVQELNAEEMVNTEGGGFWAAVATGLTAYYISEVLKDIEGHVDAFIEGYKLGRS